MIRPPPLQLKYDNRFPMPLKTACKPKSPSFAAQLYKANWKNAIIAVAGLNGLRYAFATYNAIVDAAVDDEEVFENLFRVSLALAVIYLLAFFIEVYGIVSVALQRLSMIRGYLYLTFVASLLVTVSGVIQGVAYFTYAEDIVMECAALAMQGRGYEKSMFRSRPWPSTVFKLGKVEARKHCTYAWVHQSWSQIASVFLFFLVPAVVYYLLVFTYYRQTIDPNHPANLQHTHEPPTRRAARRRSDMSQRQAVPNGGYAPLRNSSDSDDATVVRANNDQGLTTSRLQPAPAVSRPTARAGSSSMAANGGMVDQSKFATKGIKRSRRPPPLIPSPSPLGFTPGAPAYGPGVVGGGRSRVYAAFAAPVGSAGYDKFV